MSDTPIPAPTAPPDDPGLYHALFHANPQPMWIYDVNTLDGNAIVGEWPTVSGLYVASGFSGHGLQQAPAIGRYLSESILGLPYELDLSRFGPQRCIDGAPLYEHAGRLI